MYPVTYEADFQPEQNRATTFFRIILAIPWLIVGIVYYIAASFTHLIAWFAVVILGRYPEGLYNLNAGFVRYFGSEISGRKLPWHYIPVWMVITTPPLYLALSITGLASGTVYPALRRFEDAGFVASKWERPSVAQAEQRPPRKYYEVTKTGRTALTEARERFRVLPQFEPLATSKPARQKA